ncbi:MAG: alpha/beta fold hydrolase [Pseudomonadota bacterium]
MSPLKQFLTASGAAMLIAACGPASPDSDGASNPERPFELTQGETEISGRTADGVDYFGTLYFGGLPTEAPLIHLFHQGGSNGRGEYAPLTGWLNENGYRAIAWDLRSGGDLFGENNRTVDSLGDADDGFCAAYAEVEDIAKLSSSLAGNAPVIVWGSSYSGALVFQAAAKYSEKIDAVIAFSPASGGPLADCRARDYLAGLQAPALVLRPASEMERESSLEQRDIFESAGVEFLVIENGVHGSSMLVDERTENDMSEPRASVLQWLDAQTGKGN